jgi:CrcB protein
VRQTVLVGVGGMVGCIARFWLSMLVQRLGGTPFPIGTLVVNVAGSFVLGLVLALTPERGEAGVAMRALLAVGFCGGFTTMSTFSYETLALWGDDHATFAAANVALTLLACVAAVWLGLAVGRGA